MIQNTVREIYQNNADQEWKRLVKDAYHRLELDMTMKYLKKHLPETGLVLDAGGGPGRYTIELAKLGYRMTLLDLTPELLIKAKREIARAGVQEGIERVVEGSITDLGQWQDNYFDAAVTLGGPVSHVQGEENRIKAVSELVRVTKPGGMIGISVMGRLGCLIQSLKYWPEEIELTEHFRALWKNGEDDMWHKTSYAHFFLAEEITDLVEKNGIEILEKVGLEGLAQFKEGTNKLAKHNIVAWNNWLAAHAELCTNPHVFAVSGHMLVVGRKK